ncbi:hypothetical protein Q4543_17525 [Salipiger sp. 1_MG-2023]|uniref:hypothetical protein n=1 Tax=Salipiger sp. 1_MG-2023 TaxID=3062665 RepID=UPI0026E140C4|nr:hypothetical protein [Salipiger sp. 1_MG-2023]MDO6587315.1 hypothetical protein [Salipiger sp. 1_MG-2023]
MLGFSLSLGLGAPVTGFGVVLTARVSGDDVLITITPKETARTSGDNVEVRLNG